MLGALIHLFCLQSPFKKNLKNFLSVIRWVHLHPLFSQQQIGRNLKCPLFARTMKEALIFNEETFHHYNLLERRFTDIVMK